MKNVLFLFGIAAIAFQQMSAAPSSECKDENSDCAYWAKHGDCDTNPDWMLVHCKKSCKTCESGPGLQYYIDVKGNAGVGSSCSRGDKIMDGETCWKACHDLNIPIEFIDNNPLYRCYENAKGFCYKDGMDGSGASLVCKK